MSDRYTSFANSGAGRAIVRRLGLPDPVPLRRYRPGQPLLPGAAALGGGERLHAAAARILDGAGVERQGDGPVAPPGLGALVYDATGLTRPDQLSHLYDFFHPRARSLRPCGRVVVLGTPPDEC